MGISKSVPNLSKLSLTHSGMTKPAKVTEKDQGGKSKIWDKLGLHCIGVIIQDYPLSKAVFSYTPVASITTAGHVDSLYRKICKESHGTLTRGFSQLVLCNCGLSIWPWGRPREYQLRNTAEGFRLCNLKVVTMHARSRPSSVSTLWPSMLSPITFCSLLYKQASKTHWLPKVNLGRFIP